MTKAKRPVKTWAIVLVSGLVIVGLGALLVFPGQRVYQDWQSFQQIPNRVYQDWQSLQQIPNEENKRKFDASVEVSKSIVSGIGTIATIAGGIVLFLNLRIATGTLKLAEARLDEDAKKARKDSELAESRLITDRFSKAVEQLGSKEIEVRLGAIYALERIARDSSDDHWTIMEVLSAYVRNKRPVESQQEHSPTENAITVSGDDGQQAKKFPIDVQAALTVIGRRKVKRDKGRIDFRQTNLEGADLFNTHLEGVDLFGAHLKGVNFFGAHLEGARLDRAHLQGASFIGTHLEKASLFGTHLEGADLFGAYLEKAILYGVHLEKASLNDAHLQGANLYGAYLQGASLIDAHLQGASLNTADLKGANLNGAHLEGASLSGTDCSTAKFLIDSQLSSAKLCNTKVPKDSTLNPNRDCEELRS
ncbi:pentapeptide repeat-containing protein [Leptolyngbya sp. FACHB-36]|uniref:pentapeptide repeat-containing protein n=1 Tax=Leptolyngbya sp. FACHB-36 TaxID=2692808 RepID=UPI001681ADAB|nr:pentapeptide repeat-containing protein [Leptolyngbya sp. FACHB-36]MBD2019208.1 pentapeptide repeat-containing protein [Leptolyngbya sp. FACHB-36]